MQLANAVVEPRHREIVETINECYVELHGIHLVTDEPHLQAAIQMKMDNLVAAKRIVDRSVMMQRELNKLLGSPDNA